MYGVMDRSVPGMERSDRRFESKCGALANSVVGTEMSDFRSSRSRGGRCSEDHGGVGVEGGFGAVVFDASLPIVSEVIEAKGVFFGIHERKQVMLEFDPLGGGEFALEDGVLDALPKVLTFVGDVAESFATGRRGGFDVVGDEDIHDGEVAELRFEI
jgi:hypothetical protein